MKKVFLLLVALSVFYTLGSVRKAHGAVILGSDPNDTVKANFFSQQTNANKFVNGINSNATARFNESVLPANLAKIQTLGTNKGDILVYDGTNWNKVINSTTNNDVLTVKSGTATGYKFLPPTGGGGGGTTNFPVGQVVTNLVLETSDDAATTLKIRGGSPASENILIRAGDNEDSPAATLSNFGNLNLIDKNGDGSGGNINAKSLSVGIATTIDANDNLTTVNVLADTINATTIVGGNGGASFDSAAITTDGNGNLSVGGLIGVTRLRVDDVATNSIVMTQPNTSRLTNVTLGNGLSLINGVLNSNGLTTAALAGKQATGNYITALTGDVTASGPGSVASTLKNTGTAGTYRSITFDAQGRETSGSNPTTFSGYAISDSSANLAAAITDETGSGLLVFGTSPTLTTATMATALSVTGKQTNYDTISLTNINSGTNVNIAVNAPLTFPAMALNTRVAIITSAGLLTNANLTSSQLALSLSDESGTGPAIFGSNAVFVGPITVATNLAAVTRVSNTLATFTNGNYRSSLMSILSITSPATGTASALFTIGASVSIRVTPDSLIASGTFTNMWNFPDVGPNEIVTITDVSTGSGASITVLTNIVTIH